MRRSDKAAKLVSIYRHYTNQRKELINSRKSETNKFFLANQIFEYSYAERTFTTGGKSISSH